MNLQEYRGTYNYWIALGGKTSVYRGTLGSRWSACGPIEYLKEPLSSCRYNPAPLVIFALVLSTNNEINMQIVVVQYQRVSIITGPTVRKSIRYGEGLCFCFQNEIGYFFDT